MEHDGLNIAEYKDGDLIEILEIEKEAFPTPWSPAIFRSEISNPLSRMLIGRAAHAQGMAVVGYIVYWHVADEIHLHNIAVRKELRKDGIASLLLSEMIRESRVEGARWVTLEVRRSNLPAQKLYEKFGFSVKGVRRAYYSDTGEDALIMSSDLEQIPFAEMGRCARLELEMTTSHELPSLVTGEVIGNVAVAKDHFLLTLSLPSSFMTPHPGQFVMIHDPERREPLLPRPLSVYAFHREGAQAILDLLCRVAGRGTSLLSRIEEGAFLSVLGPLGRGFTVQRNLRSVILLAGGVGVAPLTFLLHDGYLRNTSLQRPEITAYVGARTKELLTGIDRLQGFCDLHTATDDGSAGYHGPVTDLLRCNLGSYAPDETVIFACGPAAMILSLGSIVKQSAFRCQVSLEERMACGIGACLGCAVASIDREGKSVYRKVCHDGPVFDIREIVTNC
jgi:dihydroorotate dehydrogenase electron transfer subunit